MSVLSQLMHSPTPGGIARVVGLIGPSVEFMNGDDSDVRRQEVLSRQVRRSTSSPISPLSNRCSHCALDRRAPARAPASADRRSLLNPCSSSLLERQSYECPNGAAQCYRLRASYSPPQLTLPIDSPFNLVPHHRPYFVRFQSLAEEGSGLAVLYADRCAKCIDDIEAMDAGPITEISQFLSTVLVLQGVEDIDSATKTTLIKSFKKLEHRHRHVFAAETLRRCIDMVEDSRYAPRHIDILARYLPVCSLADTGAWAGLTRPHC